MTMYQLHRPVSDSSAWRSSGAAWASRTGLSSGTTRADGAAGSAWASCYSSHSGCQHG